MRSRKVGDQTLRQRNQLRAATVSPPDHTAVVQHTNDDAAQRTPQRLYAVPRLQVRDRAEALDDLDHRLPWQYPGDTVGDGGHDFAATAGGQIGEDEVNDSSSDVSEGVAVEEEERSTAMTLPQELYGFGEGSDFGLESAPLCFKRCIAL
jgi:hypothetical protein